MKRMKKMLKQTALAVVCVFALGTGAHAGLTSEYLDLLVQDKKVAASSLETAREMIGQGADDGAVLAALAQTNPALAQRLVAEYVALFPSQAPLVVQAVVAVVPDQTVDIVQAVTQVMPALGPEVVQAAAAVHPGKSDSLAAVLPAQDSAGEETPEAFEPALALPTIPAAPVAVEALERPPVRTDKVASP